MTPRSGKIPTALDERLERLRRIRSRPPDEAALSLLRKSLEDRSNLVVALAAGIAAELGLSVLIPDLLAAGDRLFEDPVKRDPKCRGQTAIVEALAALDHGASAPFLERVRHVQMEAVWGGKEDAAASLRAAAVLGLVQCTDIGRGAILRHLVDAIADPADPVRIEAVRGIEQMGGEEAALLLRLKARLGDPRPAVAGQVFDSLLGLEPDRAVAFVVEYLRSGNTEAREEAALALGGSRLPAAVRSLIEAWPEAQGRGAAEPLLRALAVSGRPEALDFLLGMVRTGFSRDADAALAALEIHPGSPEIQARVEEAKRERRTRRERE